MSRRKGDSTVQISQGKPRPNIARADKLPDGLPGPASPLGNRDELGRLVPGPSTTEFAREAAKKKSEHRKFNQLLSLREFPEGHPYQPYVHLSRQWRDEHMATLAATVGGGQVGPGPASIVATAALQLGASRYLADLGAETGDAKLLLDASKLADSSRANILAAHHIAAKEAQSRPKVSPHAALEAAFGGDP